MILEISNEYPHYVFHVIERNHSSKIIHYTNWNHFIKIGLYKKNGSWFVADILRIRKYLLRLITHEISLYLWIKRAIKTTT